MNDAQKGSATAPSATQSQDLVSRGVCTCPPPRSLRTCSCGWGMLISKLLRWGYEYPRSPQAYRALIEVASNVESAILAQRDKLLHEAAAQFDGPSVDFQTEYGISKTTFYRLGLRTKRNR